MSDKERLKRAGYEQGNDQTGVRCENCEASIHGNRGWYYGYGLGEYPHEGMDFCKACALERIRRDEEAAERMGYEQVSLTPE